MPNFEPDPSAVFTQEQWVEIAQSIEHDEIPRDAKQAICDALFQYRMTSIKPDDLERFVEEARKFRASASRIQNFLRINFKWHNKFEGLIEEIWQLQRLVDREFERRPKPKGGRPPSSARDAFVYNLGLVYEQMTGKRATRIENPITSELTGPFARFLKKIFQLHGVSEDGLKHAIAKISDAKNRG